MGMLENSRKSLQAGMASNDLIGALRRRLG